MASSTGRSTNQNPLVISGLMDCWRESVVNATGQVKVMEEQVNIELSAKIGQ